MKKLSKASRKKSVLRPRIVIPFLLLTGLFLFLYLSLPSIVALVLENVFRKGTGCKVSVDHPKISYVNLIASIEDVKIQCKDEFDERGFFSEKIEVHLNFDEIFNQTIIISRLNLIGAKTISFGAESGFLKTLKFVLSKPQKPSKTKWHVWVPEVQITTPENSKNGFIFGDKNNHIKFNAVTFSSLDAVDRPETGVILEANGDVASINLDGNTIFHFDQARMVLEAKDGKTKFSRVEALNFRNGEEIVLAKIAGHIVNKSDEFFLNINSDLDVETLKDAFLRSELLPHKADILLNADLRGYFTDPKLSLKLKAIDILLDGKEGETNKKFDFEAEMELERGLIEVKSLLDNTNVDLLIKKEGRLWDFNLAGSEKLLKSNAPTLVRGSVDLEIQELSIDNLEINRGSIPRILFLSNLFLNKNYNPLQQSTSNLLENLNLTSKGSIYFKKGYELADANLNVQIKNAQDEELLSLVSSGSSKNGKLQLAGYLGERKLKSTIVSKDNNLSGDLDIGNIDLTNIPRISELLKKGNHLASGKLNISGTIKEPKVEGKVIVESKDRDFIEKSEFKFSWKQSELLANGYIFGDSNKYNLKSVAHVNDELNFTFQKFPLKYFINSDSDIPILLNASAVLSSIDKNIGNMHGKVKLNSIDFGNKFEKFSPQNPLEIKVSSGVARFENTKFEIGQLMFGLNGSYGLDKGIDLRVQANGPVPEVLASIVGMESISGKLDLNAAISGVVGPPEINGVLKIADGITTFRLGNGISGIESIQGSIRFRGTNFEINNLHGVFGDGEVKLNGGVLNFNEPLRRSGQINILADNILLEPFTGLAARIDSEMALVILPNSNPFLNGDIVLTEAIYQKEISIQLIVEQITNLILGRTRSRLDQKRADTSDSNELKLNLRARTAQGLLVNTNVLQAEVDADLKIEGVYSVPRVLGQIEATDGNFKINQTTFQILSGTMIFNGSSEINPIINLSSEGDLRKRTGETEKIFLNISGPLNDTKVSFSSDGSTPQKDIVRQLGIGGNQFILVDAEKRNIGFREVLSPSSDLSLSERFSGLTGFDSIKIETVPAIRTGEFVPQVQASRPLPYNLRGTLWSELAGDRANGARVEYKLYDDISVFFGWRSQSVLEPSSANTSNLISGFSFRDTFKGFTFFEDRVKRSD